MRFLYLIIAATILAVSSCQYEEKVLPAPQIFLDNEDGIFDMDRSDTLTIIPKITYDYSYKYWWLYSQSKEIISEKKDLEFKDSTYGSYDFTFSVMNTTTSDTANIRINVYDFIDFDDFQFDKEKEYSKDGPFDFKYVHFPTTVHSSTITDWQGFSMSGVTKYPGKEKETSQLCVQSMDENDESEIFSVYKHAEDADLRILFKDNSTTGHHLKSIDVNNTYEAYHRMYTEKLFDPNNNIDSLKITIYGYNAADKKTALTKQHYLANYQFSDKEKEKRFVQSKWETINLEKLGAVHSISFEITASKDITTTNNLPLSYFCLDNLKIMD